MKTDLCLFCKLYTSGVARIAEGGWKKIPERSSNLKYKLGGPAIEAENCGSMGVANYVLIFSGVGVSPDFNPLNLNDP